MVQCGHSNGKTLDLTKRKKRIHVSVIREKEKEVDMKKILACMSLVFALSAGATALAADVTNAYTKDDNSLDIVKSSATNMNTILITKDADILFADQNDEGLGSVNGVTSFLLKGNSLEAGQYTVTMNTKDGGEPTVNTFTISDEPLTDMAIDTQAFTYAKKDAQGKDVYDIGFKAENANIKNIRYIAVTRRDNKTAYYDIGSTITSGTANIAIRINNIPATDAVSVRLVAEKPTIPSGN